MSMGQPSLSSQMGRPNVSSGIMTQPTEDIRSQYDRLKKESADRRAGGFMGQVVLPTEGQTFEEYEKGRDKFGGLLPSGVTPRGGFNRDPMNNLFSQPSFSSSDPIRSEYDRLKKEAADQRANGFMGRVVLPTENQTFEQFRDERKNSMASFSGQPPLKTNQPQFDQSAFDTFMGGLDQTQRDLVNSYGSNQTYNATQQYRNPNMGMGIGGQRPTGMGMFGGFPQRPPQRPQGIMGGFQRPRFPQMMQRPQPMNYSGYGGMQRPQQNFGYGGMQQNYGQQQYGNSNNFSGYGQQRPQQNYGMQQPMNYSGYGQQPQQNSYQQYGMQGGGYQQNPYQQSRPQPQQFGGYGMNQNQGGYGGFAPMSNPYQPQQYGNNSNNFSGYGMQQGPFGVSR